MPKPRTISLNHYRETGEVVDLSGESPTADRTIFDQEDPATQMPPAHHLAEDTSHLQARRAEQKRSTFRRDALVAGVLVIAALASKTLADRYDSTHYDLRTITVKPNERLWNAVDRAQGFDEDPREEIHRLSEERGTSNVHPGEKITVRVDN